jgi:hypothetical protein
LKQREESHIYLNCTTSGKALLKKLWPRELSFFITRGFPDLDESTPSEENDKNKDIDSFLKRISPNFQVVYLYDGPSTQFLPLSKSWKHKKALNISLGDINQLLDG